MQLRIRNSLAMDAILEKCHPNNFALKIDKTVFASENTEINVTMKIIE